MPLASAVAPLHIIERFFSKVQPVTESGCWLWMDSLNKKGYGHFKYKRSPIQAHRFSMKLAGHKIDGFHVLHKCDVACCVNPAHLFVGTNADNMRDRDNKKRQARGERQGLSVLTKNQVDEIRRRHAAGVSCAQLGREYKTCRGNIHFIIKRETWKD